MSKKTRPRCSEACASTMRCCFDFVLKRSLRAGGKRLAAGIFETRDFFDKRPVVSA